MGYFLIPFFIILAVICGFFILLTKETEKQENKKKEFQNEIDAWKSENSFVDNNYLSCSLANQSLRIYWDNEHRIMLLADFKKYEKHAVKYDNLFDVTWEDDEHKKNMAEYSYAARKQYGLAAGVATGMIAMIAAPKVVSHVKISIKNRYMVSLNYDFDFPQPVEVKSEAYNTLKQFYDGIQMQIRNYGYSEKEPTDG